MNGSYFYVAKVTDNQDKEKLNRVKVTVPSAEESVSYWLPYLSAAAGNVFKVWIMILSNQVY